MAATLYTTRSGATQHPEEMLNQLLNLMVNASGIVSPTDDNHFLVEEADTPDMSVDVRQGYAYIKKSDGSMVYPVRLYDTDANVAISANASGNSRIDAVVLYIDLGASANTTATNVAKLTTVEGTPAGSPTAPSDGDISTEIGASNPFIRLADVTVENGETTILDADIADQRTAVEMTFPGGINLASNQNVKVNDTNPTFTTFVGAPGAWPLDTAGAGDAEKTEFTTNDINLKGIPFDPSSEEHIGIHYCMPDNWDGGTVKFRPVWWATGRSSGSGVVWGLAGRAYADGDAIDAALGTEVELTDSWTADDKLMIGALSDAVTLAGTPAGGQFVYFAMARKVGNGSDDLDVDAVLVGFILEYQANAYSH